MTTLVSSGRIATTGQTRAASGHASAHESISTAAAVSRPFEHAYRQLRAFARLGADWDTYGAPPPSARAIAAARDLLAGVQRLAGFDDGLPLTPFNVCPVHDGGIQVEWRGPSAALEVEVRPDGTYDALRVAESGVQDGPVAELSDVPASAILHMLAEIMSN